MALADLDRVTASWGASSGGWSVLMHGGAWELAAENVARHVEGCRAAAQAAAGMLRGGGSALRGKGRPRRGPMGGRHRGRGRV